MIVVKVGGSLGVDFAAVCKDISVLLGQGQRMVVVHGGSAETNEISEKLGCPPKFVTNTQGLTSRYTDRQTLEIFAMVVNGRINSLMVEKLQQSGVNAFGLSGLDGRLIVAQRKEAIRVVENGRPRMLRDDHTGKIEKVNVQLLTGLLDAGLTPVISPLAISSQGEALNVDADRAAAAVAGALGAEQLIVLTNVPGLMRRFPDESTLIAHLPKVELDSAMKFAEGRMKKKVTGAAEALEKGVGQVIFADGRGDSPLFAALEGKGTVIS
jgi:[amino group carrier protein]-L-2-aminoadipate 6-kinase